MMLSAEAILDGGYGETDDDSDSDDACICLLFNEDFTAVLYIVVNLIKSDGLHRILGIVRA